MRVGVVLLSGILAGVLAACGAPSEADVRAAIEATQAAEKAATCSPAKLTTYAGQVESQISAFKQQANLVGSTARVGMGTPLQRLLDIQTETRKLETPPCAADLHKELLSAMELYQQAYQNFSAQGSDTTTTALLQTGQSAMERFEKALPELKAGKTPTLEPFPTFAPVK